ncbi:restriction endonuclease subunit S [Clostridioides difficile]|uniref:restriction endonuclease subunit S n=1 Tax=Clostridioides difficile TaxID=1496 RepID=UPI000D1D7D70|nr:restriction endonuclease subunit S [Clostridioides difficile]MCI0946285.1 restriction endonuclease subunit S [Clostridioides difficile]MCM4127981.1 restriction endonuclease subunit S [Clostridioides difficile]MCP8362346.1 restriction endonuclease subunit S [Clostridioides difficile]MCP8369432.1 restriction endonuclease subunit S [Clostridioides difficile]MCP8376330.1 restriction endonuclease subunit S [Clostridioides difficile]
MEKLLIEICNPKQWKTISTNNLLSEGYTVYGANGVIGYYNQYTHENPTLMITCRGATCGTLNISEPFSYINGNAMALDNLTDDVHIKYLYYYLMNRGFNDVISGSAQPQITRIGLSKIKVNYPNIEIQNKIVEVLDKAQELIDKRKEQIESLDELVKSRFIEMFGNPVNNPRGWEVKRLNDISTEILSGTTPKGGSQVYIEKGIIFLRSQNVWKNKLVLDDVAYIDEETHNSMKKSSLKNRDILITKTGRINTENSSLGRAAMFLGEDDSANINGHVYLIRLKKNIINEFVLFILTIDVYREYIRSVCVGGIDKRQINKEHLEEFPIILPPVELQNEFVGFIKEVDKLKLKIEDSLKQLEDNFNSLMQKVFKGELFN